MEAEGHRQLEEPYQVAQEVPLQVLCLSEVLQEPPKPQGEVAGITEGRVRVVVLQVVVEAVTTTSSAYF